MVPFCYVGLQDSFLVKVLGMGSLGMVSGGWHGRECYPCCVALVVGSVLFGIKCYK